MKTYLAAIAVCCFSLNAAAQSPVVIPALNAETVIAIATNAINNGTALDTATDVLSADLGREAQRSLNNLSTGLAQQDLNKAVTATSRQIEGVLSGSSSLSQ